MGIAAMLAANVAHGLGHGLIGAGVSAWPAAALVGSYELLMVITRSGQAQADTTDGQETPGGDPLQAPPPRCSLVSLRPLVFPRSGQPRATDTRASRRTQRCLPF
jgi:hypothetical protein